MYGAVLEPPRNKGAARVPRDAPTPRISPEAILRQSQMPVLRLQWSRILPRRFQSENASPELRIGPFKAKKSNPSWRIAIRVWFRSRCYIYHKQLPCQLEANGILNGFTPQQAAAILPWGGQLLLTLLALFAWNVQSFHGSGQSRARSL